jgi:hypothetical protein
METMKFLKLTLLTGLAISAATFAAEDRLRDLSGAITLEAIHDDNVTMLQDGDSEFITRLNLDLNYSHIFLKWFELGLDGKMGMTRFGKDKTLDDEYYHLMPTLAFVPGTNGEYGNITFGGDYREEIAPIDSTNSILADTRTATTWVKADWKPAESWGFEAGADGTYRDYDDNSYESLQYKEWGYFAGLFITPSDRTRAGVRYTYTDKDYRSEHLSTGPGSNFYVIRNDSTSDRVSGYIDYALTGKVSTFVEVGVQSINFDKTGTVTDTQDTGDKTYASAEIVYAATDSVELNAGYKYDVTDSSTEMSNFYTQHTYSLGLMYSPVDVWSVGVDGDYWVTNENVGSDSQGLNASCVMQYALASNINLIAKYRFAKRNSAPPLNDYQKNVGSLGLSVTF